MSIPFCLKQISVVGYLKIVTDFQSFFVNAPNLHPRIRSMNICPFVSFLVAIGDPPNVILATNPDLCKVSYNSTEMFGFF